MLDWITCVQSFRQVVDSNGFAAAARRLYTTPSAVTKRIAWLEEQMGTQLFVRSTRHLALTESGQALYARSLPLLQEWEDIKLELQQSSTQPSGLLRLGVPPTFGNHYVITMLTRFLQEYPKIKIDLVLTLLAQNLAEMEMDLFISFEHLVTRPANLNIQPLYKVINYLYAAPSYLERHGTPGSLKDLAQYNCLNSQFLNPHDVWKFERDSVTIHGNFHCNSMQGLINAAIEGLGIIFVSPLMLVQPLANKALVPILPEHHSTGAMLNAYYPQLKYMPKKTQALLDYLLQYAQL